MHLAEACCMLSAHMGELFAVYLHASHALKFWLLSRRSDCALAYSALFARMPHASHAFQYVLTDWSHFPSTLLQLLPIGSVCGFIV